MTNFRNLSKNRNYLFWNNAKKRCVAVLYISLIQKECFHLYRKPKKGSKIKDNKEYSLSNKWLRVDGGLVVQTFPYKFLTHEGKGEHVRQEKDGKDPIIHCLKNRDLST